MSTSQTVIHSLLEVKGCTAELFVNDVPISRLTPKTVFSEGIAIQQYLIPGKNRVEVLIEPGSHPSVTRTETRFMKMTDAVVAVRVARFPVEGPVDFESGEKLIEMKLNGADLGDEPTMCPHSLVGELEFGAGYGRWDWQDAPVLTPSTELFDEARAALEQIAQIFETRSGDLYFDLTEEQCRDAIRAYPYWNEASVREELWKQARIYTNSPEPVLAMEPERNDFRIVADGRMLQCLDVDWTTSLKLRAPTGTVVPHPVLLARLRGELRVVR